MSVPLRPEGVLIDAAADAPPVALDELAPPGGLLVLVPHPDDESLGCGRALAAAAAAGRRIAIVLLTDGEGSHPGSASHPPRTLAALRAREMEAALWLLVDGVHLRGLRLGLPDGRTTPAAALDRADEVERLSREVGARAIWTTWGRDPHCDHEAAAALAGALGRRLGVPVWSYAVWGRFGDAGKGASGVRRFDDPAQAARKSAAIAAHRSQMTRLVDDAPDAFVMPPALARHFAEAPEIFLPGTGLDD